MTIGEPWLVPPLALRLRLLALPLRLLALPVARLPLRVPLLPALVAAVSSASPRGRAAHP
jgi:hypothetical protein